MQWQIDQQCRAYYACVAKNAQAKVGSGWLAETINNGLKGTSLLDLFGSFNDSLHDLCIECMKDFPLAPLSNLQPTNPVAGVANTLYPIDSEPMINEANQ